MELVSIKFEFNWIAPIYTIDAPRERDGARGEEIALEILQRSDNVKGQH